MDGSANFLGLYEDLKRKFREKRSRVNVQTLERCQAILQAFLSIGRPLKPYELADLLADSPAFAGCRSGKAMVLYTLKKMTQAGATAKAEYRGRKCYYRLVKPSESRPGKGRAMCAHGHPNPGIGSLNEGLRRMRILGSIARLWGIPSLTQAMAYEINQLLEKIMELEERCGDDGAGWGTLRTRLIELKEHLETVPADDGANATVQQQLRDIAGRIDSLRSLVRGTGTVAELK